MSKTRPIVVDSCAFLPCDQVERCALAPRCVAKAFPQPQSTKDPELPKTKALVGTKPGRTNRDPALIKRKRKPL